jgi:ketosteroid isomerase-like protein
MRGITLSSLFVSLALAAAPLQADPAKADPARAAVEKIGKEFADSFNRGDFSAVARMYAEDAIAFPPDSDLVRGRAAIEALWKGASDAGMKSLEFTVVDVVSSGNLAAESGIALVKMQPSGQPETTGKVKYLVVWKKGPGGWQLYRDIWNSMASTPAMAPATTPTPEAHHH